ncbi:MAG TPA: amino acid adenylation domain-containing protein, partial [Longimicrobiaceae bacterium]
WFTAAFPVRLEVDPEAGPGESLRAVKEQLRAVPGKGVGFGVLRWLSPDPGVRARLAALPRPEVNFNYLGRYEGSFAEGALFRPGREGTGASFGPGGARGHALEVFGIVADGRLRIVWRYGENRHRRATVERLAEEYVRELRALVAHCLTPGAGGCTPSDFPLARLGQAGLDRIAAGRGRLEAVYPLSPMQQGILYHTVLGAGRGDQPYLVQLTLEVRGALEPAAYERAWRETVAAHGALRTGFVWEGVDEPLQVVEEGADLPWRWEDWRALPAEEREARWEAYLREDRARGFDLARPPLVRVAVFRVGDEAYRLAWTKHHLVLDGWSGAQVLREVSARYEALRAGRGADLPRPRPYRDFVAWLRAQDESAPEAFWREALRGFRAPTPLALPKAEEPRAGYDAAELRLSGEASRELAAFARARKLTMNTLVQGAWALVLSRYAGEEDVVFGATVSGRPGELAGVEQMVGLFINTLPVRARLRPGAPAGEWLAELQEEQAEARRFEHSPLVQVQGWSEVPAGEPLFDSLLVFENYPVDEALRDATKGGPWIAGGRSLERTTFPLTLMVVPGAATALRAAYDTARFDGGGVRRMLGHLAAAMAEMARDPGRRLDSVALLSDAERGAVLAAGRGERRSWEAGTLHGVFRAQVERTPDAVAVTRGAERWSYRELDRRSDALAARLRRVGVRPEARVCVLLERAPEMVAALLGVLKAGGAYVPLDPTHPADRLAYVLEDSGARVLLTQESLRGVLAAEGVEVVTVDATSGDSVEVPDAGDVTPGHLAYVIYTSGSTGRPKGVMGTHGAAVHFLRGMVECPGADASDAFLAVTTLTFDPSVLEVFLPLMVGARVVVADREQAADGTRLARLIEDEGVTVVQATPTTWRLLLLSGWTGDPRLRLLTGGEALPAELAGELRSRTGSVWNVYGPTETTVWATVHRALEGDPSDPVAVGRPIPEVEGYVLDPYGNPAPEGVAGELYLGGPGVARGYGGRPELTAERFVPDPFSGASGARMYRTGDRVRRRRDGALEFLGRVDFQVKVRGHRIEPGEVEAVLDAHPGIRHAVVVAREDRPGDVRLVAYSVAAVEPAPAFGELRAWLRERLPEYMVPSAFVALDGLPRTPSGKVDRNALPAPDAADTTGLTPFVGPRSELEAEVARIWSEVLGVERVGVHHGFFELGGHSLRAMQLVSRVREALGVDYTLPALFAAPTVEGTALAVEAARAAGPREEDIAPARRGERSLEEMLDELEGLSEEEILALLDSAGEP